MLSLCVVRRERERTRERKCQQRLGKRDRRHRIATRRKSKTKKTTTKNDDELMIMILKTLFAHLANTRSRRSPKTPPRYPRPSTLSRTPTTLATGPIPIGGRRECPPRSFGKDCAGRSRRVRRCRRLGLGSKQCLHHHLISLLLLSRHETESFLRKALNRARSKVCAQQVTKTSRE